MLSDTGARGAKGAEAFGGVGFPHPSRVLRVILRGCGLDLTLGVLFFSSRRGGEEASLARLVWDVGFGVKLKGWDAGGEFLATDAFLPFFSTPLFGTKTSRVGGSFSGVPSSPREKDRKEQ